MPISYDSRKQTDPYLVFKRKEDIDEYLAHERKPYAKIYGCDYVNYRANAMVKDNVNNVNQRNLTVQTFVHPDIVIGVNDLLLSLKDKMLWRVESIEVQDDGQMKRNSTKARQYLVLNLVG